MFRPGGMILDLGIEPSGLFFPVGSNLEVENSNLLHLIVESRNNDPMLIYCLIYAYYGHALGSIALSQSGMVGLTQSSGGLFLLLLGIVATVLATVIVTRTSIRVLKEAIGEEE